MDAAERLARIKKRAAAARRERDEARGALRECLRRLRREHGCRTIEEAEALAKNLGRDAAEAERRFERAVERFERRWGKELAK